MQIKVIIFYHIERNKAVNIRALSYRIQEEHNFQVLSIMPTQKLIKKVCYLD